jgi:hypothetical protein
MHERRAHERRNVNHRGILSFDDGRSAVTCRLVNISEGGALVQVDTPQMLPQQVSLIYDRLDEQMPEVISAFCTVVRREARAAALKFLHVA